MSSADLITAAIAHGREGLALAERYLADLTPAVAEDVAPLWAAFQVAGEGPGPVTFTTVAAQDPALDVERWRPLVAAGQGLDLAGLERGLDRYRRWHFRRVNAERLELMVAAYRTGAAELDSLESAVAILGDGAIATAATSTAALVDRLRVAFSPETEVPPTVSTGFDSLDAKLGGGFAPGELVVIGGRPGCGKTLLGVAIGRNGTWAQAPRFAPGPAVGLRAITPNTAPVHTLFVSLEMLATELAARVFADLCDFDSRLLRTDRVATLTRFAPVIARVLDMWAKVDALSIVDLDASELAGGNIDAINRVITSWVAAKRAEHGETVPLVVVLDYITLAKLPELPAYTNLSTKDRVGEVVRRLKRVAQRQRIPIVALAQLNRESAKRDTARRGKKVYPRLEDLKECGEIEEAAATVLFVDHEFANQPGVELPDELTLDVVLAKGRNVGLGSTVQLCWTTTRTRLTEAAQTLAPAANTGPKNAA